MNTYKVTIKELGIKEVQATNPREACTFAFPDIEITPMTPGFIANVSIELLNGKRKSKHFYVGAKKGATLITIEDIKKLLVHNSLMGQNGVDEIVTYLLHKGVKRIKKISGCSKKETTLLVQMSEYDYVLIIPNNVTGMPGFNRKYDEWNQFKSNSGTSIQKDGSYLPWGTGDHSTLITPIDTLTVLGGGGLEDISTLFSHICAKTIDLSHMIKSDLRYVQHLFSKSCIENIIGLENLNFKEISKMSSMFADAHISEVHLKNVTLENVENIQFMFASCLIDLVDLQGTVSPLPCMYIDGCFEHANIGKLIMSKNAKHLSRALEHSCGYVIKEIVEV